MIDNLDLSNVYQTLHFKQNLSLIRQLLIFCYWDKYFKCNCDLYLCVPVYLCNVDKIKSHLDGKSMCLGVSADKVVSFLENWVLPHSWLGLNIGQQFDKHYWKLNKIRRGLKNGKFANVRYGYVNHKFNQFYRFIILYLLIKKFIMNIWKSIKLEGFKYM